MKHRIYFYPVWIRSWHLLNALCCLVLIYSGFSMYFSSGSSFLSGFKNAVSLHEWSGIVLGINYLAFIMGNCLNGNGRFYKLKFKELAEETGRQIRYYIFGMFRGEKEPYPVTEERKFNPLQKIAYFSVIYVLLPLSLISGLMMLFPEDIQFSIFNLSGLWFVDLFHISAGFLISVFLVIHIYSATIGFKKNFRAIITGWHEDE